MDFLQLPVKHLDIFHCHRIQYRGSQMLQTLFQEKEIYCMDFSWKILPVLTTLSCVVQNHLRCHGRSVQLEKTSEHYQKYFNVESFSLLLLRIVTKGFLVEIIFQQMQ